MASAFLSAPAANPIGFLKVMPITCLGVPCGQAKSCFNKNWQGDLPAKYNDLITKSWAVSGSREKMALRIKEYILVYISG